MNTEEPSLTIRAWIPARGTTTVPSSRSKTSGMCSTTAPQATGNTTGGPGWSGSVWMKKNAVITQAQMTSTGFADALDPGEQLDAAYGCQVLGGAYFTEKEGGFPMVNITSGCSVSYRYFDYGTEAQHREIELEIRALQDGTAVILVNGEKKGGDRLCADAGRSDAEGRTDPDPGNAERRFREGGAHHPFSVAESGRAGGAVPDQAGRQISFLWGK